MCGIFGAIVNNPLRDAEFRRFMACLGGAAETRGKDASGFAAVSGPDFFTDKAPIKGYQLSTLSTAWRNATYRPSYSFIGHTRMATSGRPSVNTNNHPFHSKKWSLVHNGIISNFKEVAEKHNLDLKTECDSEVLLHIFNKEATPIEGATAIYDKVGMWGALGIAALDRETGDVHLFRTMSIPIVYATVNRWNAVVFASTKEIVMDAVVATLCLPSNHPVVVEIADSIKDLDIKTVAKIEPNLTISLNSIKAGRSIDLYEHGRRVRERMWRMKFWGTCRQEVARFMEEFPRTKVLTMQYETTSYQKCKGLTETDKFKKWEDMDITKLLLMDNGEYCAYKEFVDV